MSERTVVLVTGANTGLGYEVIKALAQSPHTPPYHIIVGSRRVEAGEAAISKIQSEVPHSTATLSTVQVDVESDESIAAAYNTVTTRHAHLDALVNNAGAGFDKEILAGTMTPRQAWNKAYDINVTGTHIMTATFVPLLLASRGTARVLYITSGTSNPTAFARGTLPNFHTPAPGWPKSDVKFSYHSYQSSKTALNMMMLGWHRLLEKDDVKVFCVSPGFLATGLGGFGQERLLQMGALDPAVGGDTVRTVVEGERDADAGKVVKRDGVQDW